MDDLFDELKRYVGFTEEDTRVLRSFHPIAVPHIPRVIDRFYDKIREHPSAFEVITGGEAQVERLKGTLREWLDSFFAGPHDSAYYERRARIGRVHVRIGLPQHFMFTAVDVVRVDLRAILDAANPDERERVAVSNAMDRLLDIELAIMLHTYKEDSDLKLRRQSRFAAIGELAANIAHELRNPLGVIESSVYLLRRRSDDAERVTRHLDRIGSHVATAGRIITDLLEMARDRDPELQRAVVSEVVDLAVHDLAIPEEVAMVRSGDHGVELNVEPRLVARALVNLLDNAVKALDGRRGTIEIRVTRSDHQVEIAVLDDGPGFDQDSLQQAFEPLVTSRPTGVGLGLALVNRIVERHGGRAHAANRPGGGAIVSLIFPIGQSEVSR